VTWDRWLYFPSEGRHAEDFFTLKNPAALVGFEPLNLGTRDQHANRQTTEAATQTINDNLKFVNYSNIFVH
jgi:hypothetical protein